jgi:hypothetical protein
MCEARLTIETGRRIAQPDRIAVLDTKWKQFHADAVARGSLTKRPAVEALRRFMRDNFDTDAMEDVTPTDIRRFMIGRDDTAYTVIHEPECSNRSGTRPGRGRQKAQTCSCPTVASVARLKTVQYQLCAFFDDIGRMQPWNLGSATGNPARSTVVNTYVKQAGLHQISAGVRARQAPMVA